MSGIEDKNLQKKMSGIETQGVELDVHLDELEVCSQTNMSLCWESIHLNFNISCELFGNQYKLCVLKDIC